MSKKMINIKVIWTIPFPLVTFSTLLSLNIVVVRNRVQRFCFIFDGKLI